MQKRVSQKIQVACCACDVHAGRDLAQTVKNPVSYIRNHRQMHAQYGRMRFEICICMLLQSICDFCEVVESSAGQNRNGILHITERARSKNKRNGAGTKTEEDITCIGQGLRAVIVCLGTYLEISPIVAATG
jgi:hypothetical protein